MDKAHSEPRKRCGSCDEAMRVSPEKLKRLIEIATRVRPLAAEEQYRQRIEACRDCTGLQFGVTCRYCGCFVEVRTRLQDADCPFPEGAKWV